MAVVPRQAATVLLLRDTDGGLETYLLRRRTSLSFAAGKYVFPGGALEETDRDGDDLDAALVRTAVRETREETGVALDAATLVPWARWVTPAAMPKRFDTRFFVAPLPAGQQAGPDAAGTYGGGEADADVWITPAQALARHEQKAMDLMIPTLVTLGELARHDDVAGVLAQAHAFDWTTREFLP